MAVAQARLLRARRRGGVEREVEVRRTLGPVLAAEHMALVVALASGLAAMAAHGWGVGHPRWLGLKLGLVAFLLVPLEGMHAWVNHVWIPRALRGQAGHSASAARELERGLGMDDMVRTLAALLLAVALPVIAWLSLARPG